MTKQWAGFGERPAAGGATGTSARTTTTGTGASYSGTPGRGRRVVTAICALLAAAVAACAGTGAEKGNAANGAGESAAAAAPEVRPLRLVFIGTSLTAGLGLDPDSAYPALIQRKADLAGIPLTVVNAGVSGETSAGALRRIDWVLREPADVLVVETGANDGLRALRVDSTRANLEAIVERIRGAHPRARVVLVQMEAPPNLGPRYTADFRGMFPAVAERYGLTLVPFLLDRVAGIDSLNQADGIHPNEAGERIVAETVWRTLRPVLDSARTAAGGGTSGGGTG
jgi:acyl-CoA thioesterase-1